MRRVRVWVFAALIAAPLSVSADTTAPADWAQGLDGLDMAMLSGPSMALLGQNGFVTRPTSVADIGDIYAQADKAGQCPFVTTDAMLHVGHVFFDNLLRVIEIDRLAGAAQTLTDRMLADSADQLAAAKDSGLRQAAQLNIGFFAVAKAQFTPGFRPGHGLDGMVGQEVAAIDKHAEVAFRALMPYVAPHSLDETPYAYEDYSQYVPRGHYTRNETFQRYFKAMMWYGRLGFELLPSKKDGAPDPNGRKMTLQALLMADALVSDPEAMQLWRQIYAPTVYFVGKTDDLTVDDYAALIKAVFPGTGVERFADQTRQAEFMTRARALHAPKILSGPSGGIGFRFMGQRFIPDSYILGELVFGASGDAPPPPDFHFTGTGQPFTMEDIPDYGQGRAFPRGLDVMAVLGSARARELLTAAGDTGYVDYDRQFTMLSKLYAATTADAWEQNLYWRWLNALLPLIQQPPVAPVQLFLASPAWRDKQLQTSLGSWAELRHDTILYAKQSYTGLAKSIAMEPPPVFGYVEPAPEVYGRLAAMFGDLQARLGDLGVAPQGVSRMLTHFRTLLLQLQDISAKELAGQPLSDADYAMLSSFDGELASLTRFPPDLMARISSDTDSRMDVIADVHTYMQGGQVLEEGVGSPADIFVRIHDAQGYRLCRGGVFSYYEFKWPMADRLTDETWQQMGHDGKRPPRPDWAEALGN